MSDVDQRVTVCSSATEHGFVCLFVYVCVCVGHYMDVYVTE